MECAKVQTGVRKVKKKQVKDEFDRQKQAEKKKRRLEKALATSAAIISELEMKKQKKKEEQRRLDEEGAAIAEAVALHVLLDEDSNDDSCKIMLKKDGNIDFYRHPLSKHSFEGLGQVSDFQEYDSCKIMLKKDDNHDFYRHPLSKHSFERLGRVSDFQEYGYELNDWGYSDWSVSSGDFGKNLGSPYYDEGDWDTSDISAGLVAAAQAVSSLHIAEDSHVVFNRML